MTSPVTGSLCSKTSYMSWYTCVPKWSSHYPQGAHTNWQHSECVQALNTPQVYISCQWVKCYATAADLNRQPLLFGREHPLQLGREHPLPLGRGCWAGSTPCCCEGSVGQGALLAVVKGLLGGEHPLLLLGRGLLGREHQGNTYLMEVAFLLGQEAILEINVCLINGT